MFGSTASTAGSVSQLAAGEAQQLSSLEACHVQAVLQNALDKLALANVLIVDPSAQAQELTKSVGEEIGHMITQQKQLEHRFQQLIAAQPALRAMANKANLQKNQAELQDVSSALRQATKQLCRHLRENPNISENMAKVAAQREALLVLFSSTIDSLSIQGTGQPIIEAALAAEQAESHMRELVEAEKNATALVKALKNDLTAEKAAHDQQIKEKRHALAVLKSQLQQEKLQLAVDASFHAKELAASNQTSSRLQVSQLQHIRQELQLLEQQLELEGAVSSATVNFLGAKATGFKDTTISWHARREEDAANKEREVEALRAAHKRAQDVLAEAEARLRDEAAAKEARDAKLQQEAAEKAAAVDLAMKQLAAAIRIQAAWRGFKARQAAKGEKSKSSKKPSEKKAKKGKK